MVSFGTILTKRTDPVTVAELTQLVRSMTPEELRAARVLLQTLKEEKKQKNRQRRNMC